MRSAEAGVAVQQAVADLVAAEASCPLLQRRHVGARACRQRPRYTVPRRSWARAARVKRFIFISTGLVYGGNGGHLAREETSARRRRPFSLASLPSSRPCSLWMASTFAFSVLRSYTATAPHTSVLLDGRRLREDLEFKAQFPRLQDAMATGG
jgi:hypothetical protein